MSRHLLIVVTLVTLGGAAGCVIMPDVDFTEALAREEMPVGVFCRVEMPEQIVHEGVVTKASDRWLVIRPAGGQRDFWVRRDLIESITAMPEKTPHEASNPSAVVVLPGENVELLTGCRGQWVKTVGISKDFGSLGDRIRLESTRAEDPAIEVRVAGPNEATVTLADDKRVEYAWLLKNRPTTSPPMGPNDLITVIVPPKSTVLPEDDLKAADSKQADAEPVVRSMVCRVVEVLDSGALAIEGRRTVRADGEIREVSLRGEIRPETVPPGGTVFSDDVAELQIQSRKTSDPAKRKKRGSLFGWLM